MNDVADLDRYIRAIADHPKPGILFRDITPLLADGPAFARTVQALAEGLAGAIVVGIEARGFIFGAAAAAAAGVGFVPIRKPGKLPYRTLGCDYALEYGTDRVEMHVDALQPGARAVLIDDLIATGGTAKAAVQLIRSAGAQIQEARFVIGLPELGGTAALAALGVDSKVLLNY